MRDLYVKVYQKLHSGAGEFMAFTVSILVLLSMFIFIIQVTAYDNAMDYLVQASQKISRDVVACKNYEEACNRANNAVHYYLDGMTGVSNPEVFVEYTPGSERKWKKGNFISVAVRAKLVNSVLADDDADEVFTVAMIERSDEDEEEEE